MVITIIGMLAAMIFPTLGKVRIRARKAKAIAELKTIELALMDYYTEYSGFPTNKDTEEGNPPVAGAVNGLQKLAEAEYLDTSLVDAFDRNRVYTYYSSDNYNDNFNGDKDLADSCIVFSIGVDGRDNGYTNFGAAYDDAYPPAPATEPDSDNIYLIAPLSDIRYRK